MLNFLMHSGLMNGTLWAVVLTFLAVLVSRLRTHAGSQQQAIVPGFLTTPLFLGFLAAGTCLNLGYGLYKAYRSPRDGMQDIVSAQEFLAGRSLYPDRMNELMRQACEKEPRPSLFRWSATLEAREIESRERTFREHWVQAHPPLMTLFVTPFVAGGGILGAQLAVLLLSLAGLGLSLALIGRGLGWNLSRRYWLIIVLGLLGAEPIVNTLRAGQSGLLLGTLMVVGWYALRRGRPVLAGVVIALATALKMYPSLLLVYLLLRHRRAFVSAVVTLLVVVVLIGTLTGWATFAEDAATTRGVVAEYEQFPNNLSLLGLAARTLGTPGEASGKARAFFYGLALAAVAAAAWASRPRSQDREEGIALDAEFSLFVALMPLLSPISWVHYLSILLLPLAVVGSRALTPGAPRSATLGFLGILVILCVPDTGFTWPLQDLERGTLWTVATLLYMPLRT